MKYAALVKRMQVWHCEVEAETEEEARDKADALVADWPPNDDYAYDTRVTPIDYSFPRT